MNKLIKNIVNIALEEDIPKGDITSEKIFNKKKVANGTLYSKGVYVVSGLDIAEYIYKTIDKKIVFKTYKNNSSKVFCGDKIFNVSGSIINILKAERTVLNFLGIMFSIASKTFEFVNMVKHTNVKLLDTRKTIPGMRYLSKKAVLDGGGCNHRFSLSDAVLIKENHIQGAGSLEIAIGKFNNKNLEIEVKNIEELRVALNLNVKRILLDNFTTTMVKEAVSINKSKAKLEVSGGINRDNLKAYAETGVDYISIGELTHTINYADISFLIENV